MLRYFAYVFIVAMAVVMAVTVAVLLVGGLAGRIGSATDLRLTVFDVVALPAPNRVRGQAVLEDLGHANRVGQVPIFFRFHEDYVDAGWVNKRGIAVGTRRGGLPEGRHPYEAFVSELTGPLGLRATGTVWVRTPETSVLWVDAGAVLPPTGVVREAIETLKGLASGRQLVYLVATDAGRYGAMRRQLADAPLPPGPAWWVEPESEPQSLASLKRTWPKVDAALVGSRRLAEAAGTLGLQVLAVTAPADAEGAPPAESVAWPDVGRRLSAKTIDANAKEGN
ncbi:MAG: hypothetical protein WBE00_03370 [Phycisphaerae bacterium]